MITAWWMEGGEFAYINRERGEGNKSKFSLVGVRLLPCIHPSLSNREFRKPMQTHQMKTSHS